MLALDMSLVRGSIVVLVVGISSGGLVVVSVLDALVGAALVNASLAGISVLEGLVIVSAIDVSVAGRSVIGLAADVPAVGGLLIVAVADIFINGSLKRRSRVKLQSKVEPPHKQTERGAVEGYRNK